MTLRYHRADARTADALLVDNREPQVVVQLGEEDTTFQMYGFGPDYTTEGMIVALERVSASLEELKDAMRQNLEVPGRETPVAFRSLMFFAANGEVGVITRDVDPADQSDSVTALLGFAKDTVDSMHNVHYTPINPEEPNHG